ncbi:ABC transporter substrate-binding protein [Streptomyces clavuligerus]|uniref:ABC Fe transporter n=1 Tax=Streptomyces clavuligerus TaxID=1901 RepID=D5SJE7_STRCL|nr:iron-siderophore ABC transporter substrate-binding protein [Streptomyces clavuligerus]EFG04040.1 ABC Fe transporter [Streptomyces clavuligerus]MBY6307470.1 iron-siderophore ABC transporter substrate-binding protein [Streptomyces clavuligerus]QCS09970.1 iron-siderophore ABC transporter substrate-binding protein [Streptomyces clavuligerus]QPJ97987.1 ABC transporter substrate-binding protein [Streptomyces clavuligerus]WDN56677.1 iron-siderophore ABC transporter substrate-binding protein [Strep
MRGRSVKAVLAALVVGGLVAGCAGSDGDSAAGSAKGGDSARSAVTGAKDGKGPSAAPSALPDGKGTDAGDGEFPRTVGHFQGKTELKKAPRRIAVLSTGQLDDLLTLGTVPVAATRGENAGLVPDYLADAFPAHKKQLGAMTDAGTRAAPNLESLDRAKPDLILANTSLGDLYPKLSAIAPTVVTKGQGINWKTDLLLVGAAIGKAGQAQKVLDAFADEARESGARLGARDAEVSMVRFTPGRTRMFGVSSFTGSIAVDLGVKRPKSQEFLAVSEDISAERIDAADGEWIFYSVQGDPAKTEAGSVLAGPLWQSLKAVKGKRAIQVDDDPWYLNAGPTAAGLVLDELTDRLGG